MSSAAGWMLAYLVPMALASMGSSTAAWLAISVLLVSSIGVELFLHRRLSLLAAWNAGFLLILCVEGVFSLSLIESLVDRRAVQEATLILVFGQGLLEIAYRVARPLSRAGRSKPVTAVSTGWSRSYVAAATIGFVAIEGPARIVAFTSGRASAFSGAEVASGGGALGAALGVVLPSLIAYELCVLRRRSVAFTALAASPVLLLQFMSGTRFYLLLSLVGFVLVVHDARLERRDMVRLIAVGALLAVSMATMLTFRASGVQGLVSGEATVGSISQRVVPTTGDGVVLTLAREVDYFRGRPHLRGQSSAAVAVVWIPRSVWPDKPTLIGYWFPRAYGLRGFSVGHSVSAGFLGDAYADFGLLGLGLGPLLGAALARLDSWTSHVGARRTPGIAIAGPLFGAVVFAPRSMTTAAIVMSGVVFIALIHRTLLERHPLESLHLPTRRTQDVPVQAGTLVAPTARPL